jgi:hypothetical protein
LLQRRIEHEVGRYDLTGPEGTARALHAASAQVRRVNDPIARREYSRFVARLVGVDLGTVEAAVEGKGVRRVGDRTEPVRPFDRMESELLRVILANPSEIPGVTEEDFTDERLRAGYAAVAAGLDSREPGQPVDVSKVGDEPTQSLLRSLALDDRPLPSGPDMLARLKERRLDAEIAALQRDLDSLQPGSEAHSDKLRRLIALQREKRSSTEQ